MIRELSPSRLRRVLDPHKLEIETTQLAEPLKRIIGQDRAVRALRFGLDIPAVGFNTYVAGPPGIGKMTAVRAFLEAVAKDKETPSDWCYVNNFSDPYLPQVCRMPAGRARQFQRDMKSLIDHIRREIPKVFESEEYDTKRAEIARELESQREIVMVDLNRQANESGFALQSTPLGLAFVPVQEGRPLTEDDFQALPQAERENRQNSLDLLQEELKEGMKQIRETERNFQAKLQKLDRQVALYLVGGLIEDLMETYHDQPDVMDFLNHVKQDILENIDSFKAKEHPAPVPPDVPPAPWADDLPFRKYLVNVLVDNSHQEGAPVVVEQNPSYVNLFGRIEKEAQLGALHTDFTMIKPGSLHSANGGYLVLPAEDVIRDFVCWEGLKRALKNHEIQTEELGERLGFLATKSVRPQPIDLDVKVILVGRPMLHHLLHTYDEDFPELFKVKADFDTSMDYSDEHIGDYLSFLRMVCEKEGLKHLDAGASARLLEHSSRLAEDQEKLSTHFGAMADLMREANFWAGKDDSPRVTASHVQKAIDEKVYRSNLIQERIQEMIARGTLLIDTDGDAMGQVNGLSVISFGDYMFGRPSRITASVRPGRDGIIDIEREVEMGGPVHSKGVLILSGYIAQKFAKDTPSSLAARLVFEQSYEGVEGDSASSTELYALLSSLSGLPVKQGIAVTGSVNQLGNVQAIGGVNQKIEGFFDVCKVKGLTGNQGAIVPESNVKNLMLREDVVEAVKSKSFHIWAVKTVDEGIEILTGVPAGQRESDGGFPENTVNHRVDKRLREFAQYLKTYRETDSLESPPPGESRPNSGGRRR
ncbi:MAG: AAA family ATPase [Fidelibacterota bacterium]